MPLYDYRCTKCGTVTEVRHGFDEPFTGVCEKCGGALQRVFNPAPIVFKGSGFYVTDSRKKSEAKKNDTKKSDEKKSESASGDAKSDAPKPEAKSDAPKSDAPKNDSAA